MEGKGRHVQHRHQGHQGRADGCHGYLAHESSESDDGSIPVGLHASIGINIGPSNSSSRKLPSPPIAPCNPCASESGFLRVGLEVDSVFCVAELAQQWRGQQGQW